MTAPLRSRHRAPTPLLRLWVVGFLAFFSATAAWSLATPLGSGPDEPSQLVRVAAVVRGQLVGRPVPTGGARGTALLEDRALHLLTVPEVFAQLPGVIRCYQFDPAASAACAPPLSGSTRPVTVPDYSAQTSPPLYAAVAGLPTRVFVSVIGIRLARLVSCALASAMLALAVCCVRRARGSPMLAGGVAVAVTPMVLYLGSVVTPSGFEAASSVAAWSAAVSLRSQAAEEIEGFDVAALGLALAATALSRSLGPLWVLAVLAFLVVVPPVAGHDLLRRRDLRRWSVVTGLAVTATVCWDLLAHGLRTQPNAPPPASVPELHLLVEELGRIPFMVATSIGDFGWLAVPSPWLVSVVFAGAVGVLACLALATGSQRWLIAIAGLVAAWLALFVVGGLASIRHDGFEGQGRDFLGVAVGIPILLAAATSGQLLHGTLARRLVRWVLAAVAFVQLADLYWALRGFMVGGGGPVDIIPAPHGAWRPALPPVILLAVLLGGAVAYLGILWLSNVRPSGRPVRRAAAAAASGGSGQLGGTDRAVGGA